MRQQHPLNFSVRVNPGFFPVVLAWTAPLAVVTAFPLSVQFYFEYRVLID